MNDSNTYSSKLIPYIPISPKWIFFCTAVLIKNCICRYPSKIRFIAWSFLSQELKRNTSYPKVHWTFMQQWIMSAAKKKLPFFSCNLRFQSYLEMYHSPSNIYNVQIAFFYFSSWLVSKQQIHRKPFESLYYNQGTRVLKNSLVITSFQKSYNLHNWSF